jgi:hypothetical protein
VFSFTINSLKEENRMSSTQNENEKEYVDYKYHHLHKIIDIMIKEAIKSGFDLNAQDATTDNWLLNIIKCPPSRLKSEIVTAMINNGADIHMKGLFGRTALSCLINYNDH